MPAVLVFVSVVPPRFPPTFNVPVTANDSVPPVMLPLSVLEVPVETVIDAEVDPLIVPAAVELMLAAVNDTVAPESAAANVVVFAPDVVSVVVAEIGEL